MSWSAYTDSLVGSKVEQCAIHNRDGVPWAQVPGFCCSPDEVAFVVRAIDTKDNSIFCSGVKMGGKRWTVIALNGDDKVAVFKGKDPDNQKQSLVVALSAQVVVIGANKQDSVQCPEVRIAVENMRNYLKGCNY